MMPWCLVSGCLVPWCLVSCGLVILGVLVSCGTDETLQHLIVACYHLEVAARPTKRPWAAATGCATSNNQRSAAGRRWTARTWCTCESSGPPAMWTDEPHRLPNQTPARLRGSSNTL